jgi:hypothetical protein
MLILRNRQAVYFLPKGWTGFPGATRFARRADFVCRMSRTRGLDRASDASQPRPSLIQIKRLRKHTSVPIKSLKFLALIQIKRPQADRSMAQGRPYWPSKSATSRRQIPRYSAR